MAQQFRPKQEVKISGWLIFFLVVSAVLNLILIISKGAMVNPWLIGGLVVVICVYFIIQMITWVKPRQDIFNVVNIIKKRVIEARSGEVLDTSLKGWSAFPFGPLKYIITFKKGNLSFIFDNGITTGLDPRYMHDILDAMEKSELMREVAKSEKATQGVKAAADMAGIDIPGVTDKEEDDEG